MSSASASSAEESDNELPRAKTVNLKMAAPKSPNLLGDEAKKVSIKVMVHKALQDLNTKKGVSMYAIRKYIEEKYKVDTEKIKLFIKKYLKSGVESGTIIQTKGMGASGSFRLAPLKAKLEKKKKVIKIAKEVNDKPEAKEKPATKKKDEAEKPEKTKISKKEACEETNDSEKPPKPSKKVAKEVSETETKSKKITKTAKSPKKKNGIIKGPTESKPTKMLPKKTKSSAPKTIPKPKA